MFVEKHVQTVQTADQSVRKDTIGKFYKFATKKKSAKLFLDLENKGLSIKGGVKHPVSAES